MKYSEIPSPPTLLSLAISAACFIASLYTNRHLALFIASIFAISYCSLLYIIRRKFLNNIPLKNLTENAFRCFKIILKLGTSQISPDFLHFANINCFLIKLIVRYKPWKFGCWSLTTAHQISQSSSILTSLGERNEDGEECPKSMYSSVLEQMHELQQEPDSRRHFHPQILLLSGSPAARPGLVDFAHSITRGKSLLICGYIIPVSASNCSQLFKNSKEKWLEASLNFETV